MPEWKPAPDVAEIASELIESHHPHLAGVPIVYTAREGLMISRARRILGKARIVSGLNAYLAAYASGDLSTHTHFGHSFFVLEVADEDWDELTPKARRALVDHELCHMAVVEDEDGALEMQIRGHDVEEFIDVARRHGPWEPRIAALVEACG